MTDTTFDADAIAAAEGKVLHFNAGASIYRRHEKGDCAYIIRGGEVEIRERGGAVDTVRPGEIFGEVALIDDGPRTASAVALSEIELIPISRSLFLLLIRDDPDFARAVIGLMTRRVRTAMSLLERQPLQRVAAADYAMA